MGVLDRLSQWLCEVSFTSLSHLTLLSVRVPVTEAIPCLLRPTFHPLGTVRSFSLRLLSCLIHHDPRSTPYLNIHWYGNHLRPFFASDVTVCRMLDKTGQTGSRLQLVNGLILISTFALARLAYGSFIVCTSFDYASNMIISLSHGTDFR